MERLEQRFALAGQAEPDEVDLYGRTAGNLRRLLEAVGLKRRPREVSSLGDLILADHAAQVKREASP